MAAAVRQTLEIGKGKPGPGRPKNVPNKTTALLKDAILKAAEEAGGSFGLVGYLQLQAKNNPGPFLALLGKVLPLQVAGALAITAMTKEQQDAAVAAALLADS